MPRSTSPPRTRRSRSPARRSARSASIDAGVGDDRVGDPLGPLLHEGLVVVDGEHLAAEPVELSRGGGAEPAEADHEHRGVVLDSINQRWASLPVV